MASLPPKSIDIDSPKKMTNNNSSMAQFMLRIMAAVCTLSAAIVLAMAKQTVVMFGIAIHARYDYATAFKFQLYVDGAVCVFTLLSLLFACSLGRLGSPLMNNFALYLHDLVMMVLVISGCVAATTIGYVAKYGQDKLGWFVLCDKVGKFCNQVMISLVLSYLAFFCYLVLAILGTKYFLNKARG